MKIETRLINKGTMKRPGTKRSGLLGVTIHNTGNYAKGAGADNHASYVTREPNKSFDSYHWVVDDKKAIQLIPEDEVSWHAGDGATGNGNTKTISIEICVNPDSNIRTATDNAAELTAQILKRHGLSADKVYQHNHWSGKNCPEEIRKGNPYDWNTFKNKVAQAMGQATTAPAKKWVQDTILKVGDRVKSVSCAISPWPGTNNCIKGNLVYVPALGGGIPLADVDEASDTRDGKKDNYLANANARVVLTESTVTALNVKNDTAELDHAYWVKCGPLMAKR